MYNKEPAVHSARSGIGLYAAYPSRETGDRGTSVKWEASCAVVSFLPIRVCP
jgi:hypothetical protein